MAAIFTQLCIGSSVLLMGMLVLVLTVSIRSLPTILGGIVRILRAVFMFSYRFYRILVFRLDPIMKNLVGVHLISNPWRTIATTIFSVAIGCLVCLVFRWEIRYWLLGFLIIHGCFIGLVWDDFFNPPGLHIGEEL